MSELSWRDAIIKVLQGGDESLHYTDIAEKIAEQELRTEFGATPAASVSATITTSLQREGEASPFVRVSRGVYGLRSTGVEPPPATIEPEIDTAHDETGLINAFGMYWARERVLWATMPKLLGQQQIGATPVDFATEKGVYLLHDGRNVVYVGRTTEQPLGRRLAQHTSDRLNGRWDRFSWFGIYAPDENGQLVIADSAQFSIELLIVTMEALLIEGLEPPQNRKRGDDFRAIEFLQVEDPQINKSKILALMDELKQKAISGQW